MMNNVALQPQVGGTGRALGVMLWAAAGAIATRTITNIGSLLIMGIA
jgi:hypothetical protein